MNTMNNLRVPYGISVHGQEEIDALVGVLNKSTQISKKISLLEKRNIQTRVVLRGHINKHTGFINMSKKIFKHVYKNANYLMRAVTLLACQDENYIISSLNL